MDKVIVVGCGVPGYGAIRAFADKDVYLIAFTHEGNFACVSRYSSETLLIPLSDEYLVSLLIRNARQWEGALVLETSDYMATALSRNKESLSRYYRIATPDLETLRVFTEKEKTYELAERCQVPYPKTIPLS